MSDFFQIPEATPIPVRSVTRLRLVDPPEHGGEIHELGLIFWSRHAWLTRLIDTPLRWQRDRRIAYHNARMARLTSQS